MSKIKIAITDTVFPDLNPTKKALSDIDTEISFSTNSSPEEILKVASDAEAVFVTYAKITSEIISGLNKCKVIGRFGIGVDNIDVSAATEAGIVVTYVPNYCFDEVSDHAMSMLLAFNRKIIFSNTLVQSGRWEMKAVAPLNRLRDQTLGLVGFGNIPQLLAPKAKAFGLDVITYDPYVSNKIIEKADIKSVSFDELLLKSDFVSIHAPHTKDTTTERLTG